MYFQIYFLIFGWCIWIKTLLLTSKIHVYKLIIDLKKYLYIYLIAQDKKNSWLRPSSTYQVSVFFLQLNIYDRSWFLEMSVIRMFLLWENHDWCWKSYCDDIAFCRCATMIGDCHWGIENFYFPGVMVINNAICTQRVNTMAMFLLHNMS